jgi:hypothetical protein
MVRVFVLLPLLLAACTVRTDIPPSPAAAGRPVAEQPPPAAAPDLKGRWTIAQVNGRSVAGLLLELGGEGLVTLTKVGNAVYVRSPHPQTRAHLGCNWWHPSGWTREGNTLSLGREASRRTEMGCDEATKALDDQAYAIISKPMSYAFISPDGLRLVNDSGTLELARESTEGE